MERTQKDPSGKLKDVRKLTFIPCEKVHPMTMFMFEVGINLWATQLSRLNVSINC